MSEEERKARRDQGRADEAALEKQVAAKQANKPAEKNRGVFAGLAKGTITMKS